MNQSATPPAKITAEYLTLWQNSAVFNYPQSVKMVDRKAVTPPL